jgi:hypothetical protein
MAQSAAGDPPDLIGRQPARSRGCWLGIRVLGAGGFERAHLHMPARTRGSRRRLCASRLTANARGITGSRLIIQHE